MLSKMVDGFSVSAYNIILLVVFSKGLYRDYKKIKGMLLRRKFYRYYCF